MSNFKQRLLFSPTAQISFYGCDPLCVYVLSMSYLEKSGSDFKGNNGTLLCVCIAHTYFAIHAGTLKMLLFVVNL